MSYPDYQHTLPDRSVYDLILWSIPVVLVGGAIILCAVGVPQTVALATSSTVAAGIIIYGLFGNPPQSVREESN